MADTGAHWSAWGAMLKGGSAWSADAITDTSTENGDAVSLDMKVGCEVGLLIAGGAGTVAAAGITIRVLRDGGDGTNYETLQSAPWSFTFLPVASTSLYKSFFIDPIAMGSFKLEIFNDSDVTVTITATYRTATIPAAS